MSGYRQRRRNRVSWLVLFALLFQQLAISAYACTLTERRVEPTAMMTDCAGMALPMPAAHVSPPCEKHCHPDNATSSPLLSMTVPSLALPPSFDFFANQSLVIDRHYLDVPISRSDPPPLLRFCSLQI